MHEDIVSKKSCRPHSESQHVNVYIHQRARSECPIVDASELYNTAMVIPFQMSTLPCQFFAA